MRRKLTTPTVTRYETVAKKAVDAFDALMAEVPKLKATERRHPAFIRANIGVPFSFVMTTAALVNNLPELERMQQMDLEAALAAKQLSDAFRSVIDRLAAGVKELQTLLDTRHANASAEALKVYDIVKVLAKRSEDIRLRDARARMKRELGKRGRPRKTAAAAPAKPRKRKSKPRSLPQKLKRRKP
jgi:hypothetical protein